MRGKLPQPPRGWGSPARAVKMRRPAGPARCSGGEVPPLPSVPPGRLGAERRPGGALRKPRHGAAPLPWRSAPGVQRHGRGAGRGVKKPHHHTGGFFAPSTYGATERGGHAGSRAAQRAAIGGGPLTQRAHRATARRRAARPHAPPPFSGPQGRRNVPPWGLLRRGAPGPRRVGRGAPAGAGGGPARSALGGPHPWSVPAAAAEGAGPAPWPGARIARTGCRCHRIGGPSAGAGVFGVVLVAS